MTNLKAKIEALRLAQVRDKEDEGYNTALDSVLALIATHAAEPAPVAVEGMLMPPTLLAVCQYCDENGEDDKCHPIADIRWDGQCWACEECGFAMHPEFYAAAPRADLAPTDNTALVESATRLFNACNAAWAAGEPLHKVVKMVEAAEDLGAVLATLSQPAAPQPAPEVEAWISKVQSKLHRFNECAEDNEDVDIGREWLDALTTIGLIERICKSPARWQLTEAGERAALARGPVAEKGER